MLAKIRTLYGLADGPVLSAMREVPRNKFIPSEFRYLAYEDQAVSVGYGQTISQPYTVAFMTHLLGLARKGPASYKPTWGKKVLEIGTGSGYQAAILSLLADKVYTVERISALASSAKKRLRKLGFKNVQVKVGMGETGWEEKAPFDAIIVTAGVEDGTTNELLNQLKIGGVLVAPVGQGGDKVMTRYTKRKRGIKKEEFGIFHFVPFVESN